ncbi:hypothetical protein C5167_044890 [Papaver somniferum]|uniref:Uncharacterized protein n=1 Tax=Papaver somniferum TaxID=3469 RepID=A0A4Y7LBP1_PAPSO|nr:hypothetical protein C5167_044890 [Papaver somniferum]
MMRDGMIVQSGKYNELLSSGLAFSTLVAAHETSMELVENSNPDSEDLEPSISQREAYGDYRTNENGSISDQPESQKTSSKLVEDEQ